MLKYHLSLFDNTVRIECKYIRHQYLGSVEAIETRNLVIHFHLEDETIEVAEDHDINSGRYKAPLFLKRCKIPKVD